MRVRAPRFEAALPSRVNGYFPRGPKFFTTGNIAFGGLISQVGYFIMVCLGLPRGPHWPFPGPEQLARFCDIAIILLAIINSHGLHSLYFSHVPNWRARALQFEKLKKSEILGMASWALWSHGLESL